MSKNVNELSPGDFVYPNEKICPISSEDNRYQIPKKKLLRIKSVKKGLGKDPLISITFQEIGGIWDSNYFVPVQKKETLHVRD